VGESYIHTSFLGAQISTNMEYTKTSTTLYIQSRGNIRFHNTTNNNIYYKVPLISADTNHKQAANEKVDINQNQKSVDLNYKIGNNTNMLQYDARFILPFIKLAIQHTENPEEKIILLVKKMKSKKVILAYKLCKSFELTIYIFLRFSSIAISFF
jgi:hypothetical protein